MCYYPVVLTLGTVLWFLKSNTYTVLVLHERSHTCVVFSMYPSISPSRGENVRGVLLPVLGRLLPDIVQISSIVRQSTISHESISQINYVVLSTQHQFLAFFFVHA
jgi:hypothetical protein